ncbi:MAG: response regulator [Thermodesulfovibrio sp.]|nr:response regulator [Thermodesulfovibrio sp.]MDW7998680.1 response regulator [Thermodesulfovibrio sp.]
MAREKILIVDDSPIVRKLAEIALQEAEYEVYTAADGEEGLKIAEEIKPDLIFVDLIMPKVPGPQFCKIIKEKDTLKDIPIILITGKGETVGKIFIEKYQTLDYFIKPFKSEDLIEKVRTALSKIKEKKSSEIDLEFETDEIKEDQPSIEIDQVEEIKPLEEGDILKISEEEIKFDQITFEEPQKFIEEVDLNQIEEKIDIEEKTDFEISEKIDVSEIEELESIDELKLEKENINKEFIQTDYDKIEVEQEIEKKDYTFSGLETLIDNKMDSFLNKIAKIIDTATEGTLKKYGLIKDTSYILFGDARFFKISEVCSLIGNSSLSGILTFYGSGEIYEFLFIKGKVIYGISNMQRQKMDNLLLSELSDQQVKALTLETVNVLENTQLDKFIFEIREIFDQGLLNKEGLNVSELFNDII